MIETVKIDIDSVEYPARLREIHNPPAQLYCAGNISLLNERSVGVVGARKNTVYGKNVALFLSQKTWGGFRERNFSNISLAV